MNYDVFNIFFTSYAKVVKRTTIHLSFLIFEIVENSQRTRRNSKNCDDNVTIKKLILPKITMKYNTDSRVHYKKVTLIIQRKYSHLKGVRE